MTTDREKKWEKDVRNLVTNLNLEDQLTGDVLRQYQTEDTPHGLQIDACGGIDQTYIVIDATVSVGKYKYKPTGNERLWQEKRRRNIEKIIHQRFPKKYKQFRWVVWVDGMVNSKMRIEGGRFENHIFSRQIFDSYKKRADNLFALVANGQPVELQYAMLKYRLLRMLDAPMPELNAKELEDVPAIRFRYRIKSGKDIFAYALVLKPDSLIRSCYVLKRDEVGTVGYQRLLDERRLVGIRKFIEKTKSTFPSNIIINFEKDQENPSIKIKVKSMEPAAGDEDGVRQCIISLPKIYCSAQIIDGQHRLFAFEGVDPKELREDLKLDVLAFDNLSKSDSATIFLELNKEQKKVPSTLSWDIIGEYLKESPEGAIATVVKKLALDKGIFHKKIEIPGEQEGSGDITLANFCKGIDDRGLLRGTYEDKESFDKKEQRRYKWNFYMRAKKKDSQAVSLAREQLNLFFKLIQKSGTTKAWKKFIMTNNGLNIALRVLVEILKYYKDEKSLAAKHYKKIIFVINVFAKSKTAEELADIQIQSSEGMRGRVANAIMQVINKKYPGFAAEHIGRDHIGGLKKIARRITSKKKRGAYKELIKFYSAISEWEEAFWWAVKMHREFDDDFSQKHIKKLYKQAKELAEVYGKAEDVEWVDQQLARVSNI